MRSMLIEDDGNLIVGTEPSGLVLRISPQGQAFVLYQTNKREVTAVAERDGVVYAAAVGNKPRAAYPSPVRRRCCRQPPPANRRRAAAHTSASLPPSSAWALSAPL